jgi:hypothetical protein
MSWPSVRTSDLLVKTSEKFASASLQLQHLAQEAHTREIGSSPDLVDWGATEAASG